jgi:excisionase family DNA binding protein
MSDNLFKNVEFPDQMDLRLAAIYINVSEGRIRTLLREGTIQATKTDANKWVISKDVLDEYKTRAPAPRAGGGGTRGEGKAWVIKVPFAKLQAVKDALAPLAIELQPRYNYAKQKEYQAKKKAEKAAAAKAGKVAAPAPAPVQPKR